MVDNSSYDIYIYILTAYTITHLNTSNQNISDAMYQELRLRHVEDLSLYEIACLRVADQTNKYQKEFERTRLALTKMSIELENSRATIEAQGLEITRYRKLQDALQQSQKLESSQMEDKCNRLTALLTSESALRREYEEKAFKYDNLSGETKRLQQDIADLRNTVEKQSQAISSLTESEKAARMAASDSDRARELLAMDKNFLQAELKNAIQYSDERSRAVEKYKVMVAGLESKITDLTDKITTLQLNARTGLDKKLEREVSRLREDSQREIESLKAAARDLADRENRVLREAKASLDVERENLRRRNDTLVLENKRLTKEMSDLDAVMNRELSDLRAELKMKTFEIGALGASYEERMSRLRQTELELEVAKEEVNAHRTAMLRLEADSHLRDKTLSDDLEKALQRLRAYELIEEEIDKAVIRAAKFDNTSTDGAVDSLLNSIKGVASSPERRLKQAVYLAQRLLETERQRDEIKERLDKTLVALENAKEAATQAREDLKLTSQPTTYLVAKLRDEETSRLDYMAKCKALELELQSSRAAQRESSSEADSLRQRLNMLLQQRGEIDSLKGILEQLQEDAEGSEVSDDYDEEVERDEGEEGDEEEKYNERNRNNDIAADINQDRRASSQVMEGNTSMRSQGNHHNISVPSIHSVTSVPSSPHGKTSSVLAIDMGNISINDDAALGLTPDVHARLTSRPSDPSSHQKRSPAWHTREEI